MNLRRLSWTLRPDPSRVLLRPFVPGDPERVLRITQRALSLPEQSLQEVRSRFGSRHRDLESRLERRCPVPGMPRDRAVLLGAVLSCEYAFQGAALFNPSMVPHPDQSGLPAGSLRVVMSLRAVGEGHISSLEFRSGLVAPDGEVTLDPPGPWATTAEPQNLPDGGYTIEFPPEVPLAERVLFPSLPEEKGGIEDFRFVAFEDGRYFGTCTAYDGRTIRPRLLETSDFRRFRMHPLAGDAARDKGMALFPRRLRGRYAMIGRQDAESLFFLESDRLDHWEGARRLWTPRMPWEAVQMGNCGSPIETSQGWLLLTHGVAPLRRYCIGALLLDLEDPGVVRGVLEEPLLEPREDEREGYVPNVVYSCGGLVHGPNLILPYGASDVITRVAVVPLAEVLGAMKPWKG